jgi:hypothetical protein
MLLKRHGWATFTNADTEGRTSILPVSAERNKTKKSPNLLVPYATISLSRFSVPVSVLKR